MCRPTILSLGCSLLGLALAGAALQGCSESSTGGFVPQGPGSSQVIGAAGGTISQGGVTLEVPPGALSQDVTISIEATSDIDLANLPNGFKAQSAGAPYKFSPSGLTFLTPVKVTIPATKQQAVLVGLRDDVQGSVELLQAKSAGGGTWLSSSSTFRPPSLWRAWRRRRRSTRSPQTVARRAAGSRPRSRA